MSSELVPQPQYKGRGGYRGGGRPRNEERAAYKEAVLALREKLADGAANAAAKLLELVNGVMVQGEGKDGTVFYYRTPPSYQACVYWIDRVMGRVSSEADTELAQARATLIKQQIAANFYMWQAQYLKAQAEGKAIENEQWPKQFVSEEEVSQKIQVLAAELNKPLLHMTPEMWERFKASPNGLEEMKAHLGRSQASVYAAVMESDMDDSDKGEEEGESDEE